MTTNAPAPEPLTALAEAAGLAVGWTDSHGREQTVTPDTLRAVLEAMALPAATPAQIGDSLAFLRQPQIASPPLTVVQAGERLRLPGTRPRRYRITYEDGTLAEGQTISDGGHASLPVPDLPGYHQLEFDSQTMRLAVAPARCPSPSELLQQDRPRAWGIAAQIYSLRHADPALHPAAAGYGDFGALAELACQVAQHGADALAISPVHAMFSAEPGACSPYAPSSRLFLNVLYADPCAVFTADEVRAAMAAVDTGHRATALEQACQVDWPAAGALRMALLRKLYDGFPNAAPVLQDACVRFRQAGGEALQNHAVFEVLHARHAADSAGANDWRQWPDALRDPGSPRTRGFGAAHEREVGFHIFAQWLARTSLAQAQSQARHAGMRLGLIADLAVGTDPRGSHAWSRQADVLADLSIGAPPDIFNSAGQQWGLAAFSPQALRDSGYAAFIEMLRAVLADTGGLRVDHVLGLARLWVVPPGASPAEGAYLHYPLDDLLRLIALEAWRHRALIVGENLGTVPAGFNERLSRSGILGTSVLWFQTATPRGADPQTPASFLPAQAWPADAIAMPDTHDLPTLRGWWEGRDLHWRERLRPAAAGQPASARRSRQAERTILWASLHAAGLAGAGPPPDDAPIAAMLGFVAATPAPLMLAPLEDLAAMADQPNLPGTVGEHPNWRQRLPHGTNALLQDPTLRACIEAIKAARSAP
ncbi:4-alpha-glucanotransferase [Bordetella sp. BOR01]|uniref:4-alpha-glucanotransferase n=1 Tax=Bordetella sp. BOR01 TaxID=2854779 RepID=UPI001C43E0BD|nr:4-alpha-glucanotransferase [Bordetella sp. BOR01]MBV7486130.1 4-alpha-glucanotransferase [Bordetella sp. BOR01]